MADKIKLIPYGISDFKQIRKENKYLVDKTMYFQKLEDAGNFLFLARPRRFGKSLFLSMLEAYYDVNDKDDFEQWFQGLYVGSHSTVYHNQYLVLHLDFSLVGSDVERLEENFNRYCDQEINKFVEAHVKYFGQDKVEMIKNEHASIPKLNALRSTAELLQLPLYLIVDEYDNFTNNVLNVKGQQAYHDLTHGTGFYRDIFKIFKATFKRIIMLGVSPITLDDLTSGYNIALNITMDERFNQMLGFSEEEVRQMIRYYKDAGAIKQSEEEIIADMKPWYDNYCFAEESFGREPSVFNSDMVCYYLDSLVNKGKRPKEMLDANTGTDYVKLQRLVEIDQSKSKRISTIHKIVEDGYIIGQLVSHFPAERMMEYGNFISLLYYYGMLTIGGVDWDMLKLVIPNNNVRKQYYNYLLQEYQSIDALNLDDLKECFKFAARDGNWRPLIETICKAYHDTTSVRQLVEGERNLQGFMTAYLNLTNYYAVAPEQELNHGYCDFFLLPDIHAWLHASHSYILELKYLKANATDAEARKQWDDAVEQIKCYAQDEKLRSMLHGTTLHLVVVQIKGCDLVKYDEVIP